MKSELMQTIFEKGIRAPSADNLQPWKFQVHPEIDQAEIYLDPDRLHHFSDLGGAAPHLSCGALIENIGVASRQWGYRLKVEYLPEKKNACKMAHLHFDPASPVEDPHFSVLDRRATNRKFYEASPEIPDSVFTKIQTLAEENSEARLLWLKRQDWGYSHLAKIVGRADQLRFEIQRLHEEFISLLRFGSKQAEFYGDGLEVESLEAGLSGPAVFKLMGSWSRMKSLNRFGMSRMFNFYARLQMLSSRAAGLLIARKPSNLSTLYLKGGELMERIWHEATLQGLAFQPMEALPIFDVALRSGEEGLKVFTADQRTLLSSLLTGFRQAFQIGGEDPILFLFRVGYASPSTTHSKRRPYQDFLLKTGADA